jgi:hypothetical protein
MKPRREDWQDYIEAARRKIFIAAYHAERLKNEPSSAVGPQMNAPSIPAQAHFEGVIVSIMAAVDQVAQAVNSALLLRLDSRNLVKETFTHLAQANSDVGSWFGEPIGRDLRRIRVRMVHYQYAKTPQGPCWAVESSGRDYDGSRELVAYANRAVEYGEHLRKLLPLIEAEIAKSISPANTPGVQDLPDAGSRGSSSTPGTPGLQHPTESDGSR